MKVYFAGTRSREWIYERLLEDGDRLRPKVRVLESFCNVGDLLTTLIPRFDSFMLDSGAFSFFNGKKMKNVDAYISRYAEYITANDIKLFFELDIDKIIGYDKVKEVRRRLELATGKRPIPVWHKHLGKQEFIRMCDEYDYVAIGGIVSGEITKPEYKVLPAFIRAAHERGTKIHGLGFTNMDWLPLLHFDSVDSTSWTSGNKFGYIWKFDGRRMKQLHLPPNTRLKHAEGALNNFTEWLKFASYAERKL